MSQETERLRDAHKWFGVASGEYGEKVPVTMDGDGPIEYGRDFLWVRARTAKRAKVLMVRAMRRRLGSRAWRHGWLTDGNPFAGMIATRANTMELETESDDR